MKIFRGNEQGKINIFLITTIVFFLAAAAAGYGYYWANGQANQYKEVSQQEIDAAVKAANETQQQALQVQFDEEFKKPFSTFRGSQDLGAVTFEYPKTWSRYDVSNSGTGLNSYFYPNAVPNIDGTTALALHVEVQNKDYAAVIASYDVGINNGTLSATTETIGRTEEFAGYEGTRISGQFNATINGAVVIFKIRDKTLLLAVESQTFMADFNNTILQSLQFIQ